MVLNPRESSGHTMHPLQPRFANLSYTEIGQKGTVFRLTLKD